jgi:NTP pyrophosphatase (non-canonical NTP hydrolase)
MCSICGLIEEEEEVIEAIYSGNKEAVIKELGDLLWYSSSLAIETGTTLQAIYDNELNITYKNNASPAKILKKTYRDFGGEMPETYKHELWGYIHNLLHDFADSFDLSEAMTKNIEKLSDRYERGMISGDGDNR